jgi:NAD(P)-dependent dehydrogenase (short-subunit alcohol dehydrogenase family)
MTIPPDSAGPRGAPSARAVVIGATGGIGSALARRLAQTMSVHLVGRDAQALADLAAELPGATRATCDVLDTASLRGAIAEAGPAIGALAYCVGSIVLKPLQRATEADYLDAYRINVVGAAMAVAAARDALRAGGGEAHPSAVILFSSIAARAGFPNHAIIGSAKAAVEGLGLALAAELAPAVRVNVIAPSLTRTRMAAALTSSEAMAKGIAQLHPLPRLGEAEDAAALAAFLLSPEAGWITGQVYGVDGGRSTLRTKG